MEREETTGALQRYFGKKEGQKTSSLEMAEAYSKAKRTGDTKPMKRTNLAKILKKHRKGK